MHPMELLSDVGHVEPHLFPYGDSVSVSATLLHGLCQMYHQLRNCFGRTRWNSKVAWVMWNLTSFMFGDSASVSAR